MIFDTQEKLGYSFQATIGGDVYKSYCALHDKGIREHVISQNLSHFHQRL